MPIIAHDRYDHVQDLKNRPFPKATSQPLAKRGFHVTIETDHGSDKVISALIRFRTAPSNADEAMNRDLGHGIGFHRQKPLSPICLDRAKDPRMRIEQGLGEAPG